MFAHIKIFQLCKIKSFCQACVLCLIFSTMHVAYIIYKFNCRWINEGEKTVISYLVSYIFAYNETNSSIQMHMHILILNLGLLEIIVLLKYLNLFERKILPAFVIYIQLNIFKSLDYKDKKLTNLILLTDTFCHNTDILLAVFHLSQVLAVCSNIYMQKEFLLPWQRGTFHPSSAFFVG